MYCNGGNDLGLCEASKIDSSSGQLLAARDDNCYGNSNRSKIR